MKIKTAHLKNTIALSQASTKLEVGKEGVEAMHMIPEGLLVVQKSHPNVVISDSNLVSVVPVEQNPAALMGFPDADQVDPETSEPVADSAATEPPELNPKPMFDVDSIKNMPAGWTINPDDWDNGPEIIEALKSSGLKVPTTPVPPAGSGKKPSKRKPGRPNGSKKK